MTKCGDQNVLLKLIELTGKEWEANERAEDIRLSPDKIDALLSIRALVASEDSTLTVEDLREQCPTFCSVYRQVMLRDLEEFIPHGAANS